MTLVLAFLKKIFSNRWVRLITIGLVLLALGYALGRYAQPAKVVTKTQVVTKVQTQIVYQDRVITKVVKVKVKASDTHTETTTTKAPDGTVVTKTDTDVKVNESTDTNTNQNQTDTGTKNQTTTQVATQTKTVTNVKPGWRIGAGVGLSIPSVFQGKAELGLPGMKGSVVELSVERRIVGPLWFTLRGNTQGTATLGLGGEF